MKNYNYYNLNPPEPVIIEIICNPYEDYMGEMIAEHNFEISYGEQYIIDYDYMERHILNELIKNEQYIF